MRRFIRSVCSRLVDTDTVTTFSVRPSEITPATSTLKFMNRREQSKIEITSARDPCEHLRMEHLVQRHHVGLTGPLKTQGTKRTGREIAHVVEFEDHRESRARHLSWIKTAAEGKAGLGRYGKSYELLIVVEDWWFNNDDDATEVVTFIDREVLTLPLEFGTVHLVGLTERLFMSFPLGLAC